MSFVKADRAGFQVETRCLEPCLAVALDCDGFRPKNGQVQISPRKLLAKLLRNTPRGLLVADAFCAAFAVVIDKDPPGVAKKPELHTHQTSPLRTSSTTRSTVGATRARKCVTHASYSDRRTSTLPPTR